MSGSEDFLTLLRQSLSKPGRHAIPYIDPVLGPGHPLTLHAYRARGYEPADAVVMVQHGMMRNGDEYRDFWMEPADRHNLLIVATTFSDAAFPRPESYNNGMVLAEAGGVRPRAHWVYAVIARVFQAVCDAGITTRQKAHLFGHSAGGQFVHRLLGLEDSAPFETAIAGNPGWYSLPTLDRPFPEGLDGIGLADADVDRLLAFPLTILAGDRDIETSGPSLPAQPEAVAQGPHRFARAHNYVAFGQREAVKRGVICNWRLQVVPGIGHDGDAMSKVAASLWFEARLPEPATLQALAQKKADAF